MGIESTKIKQLLQNIGVTAKPPVVYSPHIKEYPRQGMLRRAGGSVAAHPKESLEALESGANLYTLYAQHQELKKKQKTIKKETKKKLHATERQRKARRILRRPSRERGIL